MKRRHKKRTVSKAAAPEPSGKVASMEEVSPAEEAARADIPAPSFSEAEKIARSLIENSFDLTLLVDRDGKILHASPSVERILGYTPEEAIGASIFEYIHPEDMPQSIDFYYGHNIEVGLSSPQSFRVRCRNGSWRHLEATGTNRLRDPSVRGIVVNARDITERKCLEEELQRSEEYFRSLIERSSDVIAVLDRRGVIRYASPSVAQAGYSVEEVVGRNILDFASPGEFEPGSPIIREILQSPGITRSEEVHILHRDGSWHLYESSATNMLDNPDIKGVIIHARDITERRESERFNQIRKDLAVALSGGITLEHALEISLGGILAATGLESGAIYLAEEDTGQLNLAHHVGFSESFVKRYLDEEWKSRHAALMASGEARYISYSEAAPEMRNAIESEGLRAVAAIPISYEGKLIGCLDLASHSAEEIPQSSRNAIEILAGQVAQAIAHARLLSTLKESEERYRIIYDYTGDPIYTYDTNLTLIGVNKKACELIGYSEEEIVGKNILELNILHPGDIERAARDIQRLFAGEVVNDEVRFIRKDGSVAIGDVTGSPLYDGEGNIIAFTNVARDITEKKAAEAARRESEEKYRLIYENAQEAIFTYDRNLRFLGMNSKACELSGYSEEELSGKNIFDLGILHPDDVEKARESQERLLGGETVQLELRFITRSGSVVDAEVTVGPVMDQEGRLLAVTNVARDITERKRAEERMDKLNQCLLGLGSDPMENIVMIVHCGRDILKGMDLRYGRLDGGRLSVFTPRGKGGEFVPPAGPEDRICRYVIDSGEDNPIYIDDLADSDFANDPELAERRFASFLAFPVRLRGKTVGSLCFYGEEPGCFQPEDITSMGMLARALTIEEERLAHEESIRNFVDIASHELRTPLSIIKGYADAFQSGDLPDLTEYQLDKIRIINSKADKMTKTINDLLDLSRIERGHFVMEKRPVDIRLLLESAVRQMREKGVDREFKVRISEGVREVRVDPEMVLDLFAILLDNAVHYSPASSVVEIEAESLGSGMLASVIDHGPGIPEESSQMIFERFYQLEDSRHHSSSGMGLGLYIAREIAEGHGGRIWHENREDGGSIFRFLLP